MPWCASGRPSRPPSPRSICRLRAGWPAGATGQWPPACARSRPCPRKFTATAPAQHAVVTVAASLAGTHSLARPAGPGRADFATAAREAVPALRAADLSATVVTMQGPIRLADYLITRCVEAVVHGCGPAGPARPDRAAQAITAGALPEALAARAPHLVREARQLPLPVWIDAATGRQPVPGSLAAAVPVMTSAARAARGMAHPFPPDQHRSRSFAAGGTFLSPNPVTRPAPRRPARCVRPGPSLHQRL